MAELQFPNVVGSYLASYNDARQQKMAEQDRERTYQRQDRQDQMAEQQFSGQMDAQKLDMALKRGQAMASIIGGVRDGDAQGFEAAKQRAAQELGLSPEQMAHLTINDLPRLRSESGLALKQLQEQAMRANIRQSDAAADASRAAAEATRRKPVGNVDPNTGVRIAPQGTQNKDVAQLQKYEQTADAFAGIATTLRGAQGAFNRVETGPGTGLARLAASPFAAFGVESANQFVSDFDAIDAASKEGGIEKLKGIGGSDTERELLTAIQTGVGVETTTKENKRRVANAIAAADIAASRHRLATEWFNKFGSLAYAAPNGMTWPQFWSSYQKQAWADHLKGQKDPGPEGGARNYRQEQRDLQSAPPASAVPPPPPGFEVR